VAPAPYAQSVTEGQIISEKEIDRTSFNKNINEVLNIETILLLMSMKSLHLSL